ncbi:PWWP domain protein [Aspergillus puulaauensis]|uniref:PWWP domain-containing protein n=1 Tax=Aspergillus puulaauensis TaxID=1220207 RepID=A0A7R8AJ24_9EURO|nr:uncharacterized protein APUU_21756A [Aspergillus puulaauensis]BCS21324.1 hypothetical protein APUU_21756A [Aspergillus puulaauensis]
MAEANTTPSAPAPEAGEASAERASAELQAGPQESATEPSKASTEKEANGADEKPAESTTAQEDKKESSDAAAEKPNTSTESADAKKSDEGPTAPEPNGTPKSTKKSSAKRKSTGGDTKSKLNRKKSMTRITQLDAKPGDYYLARLRSFAPWPAILCDEEILPQTLLESRPVTAQRDDGTYREDFADGGKRAAERTFPVMFLHTNEFAWIPNTDLSPLDPATCKDVSEKGKAKSLVAAYGVAAEGHDLAHFKEMLADHQRAIQQEEEEREAAAASKAAAKAERDAKKNKRKSMDIQDDVDVEDEGGKPAKSSKKRKKDAEAESEKPSKTPKTGTKLKLTTPKAPTEESGKKAAGPSKAKQSASKKGKKAAAGEGSDDSRPVSKDPEPQVNLEEAKKKREREVLFVRHRLQKGFISRDHPPKEEEMAQMSTYFNKLEKLGGDLEVSIIRETKIHKVLRMILKLPNIPRDEEFNFRKRALDVLSKWKNIMDGDRGTPSQEKEKDEKPKANGVRKEKEGTETPSKTEKEEDTKLDSPEQDTPMPDADEKKTEETPAPAKSDADKAASEPAEKEDEKKEKPAEEAAEEKTAEAAA